MPCSTPDSRTKEATRAVRSVKPRPAVCIDHSLRFIATCALLVWPVYGGMVTSTIMYGALSPAMARFLMNVIPCIRGTGGRVVSISDDFRRLRVRLKLNWRTRNLVGTIYGGSMYAATDPFYMLM